MSRKRSTKHDHESVIKKGSKKHYKITCWLGKFQCSYLLKKSGNIFGWVFFLISLGSPHVRPTGVGRTCGGPNEIELPAIGVELNGSWRVHVAPARGVRVALAQRLVEKVGNLPQGCVARELPPYLLRQWLITQR